MEQILHTLFPLTLSATVLILFLCILRLVFQNLPRRIFVMLWLFVALRLLCPVSFQSSLSVLNALPATQNNVQPSTYKASENNVPSDNNLELTSDDTSSDFPYAAHISGQTIPNPDNDTAIPVISEIPQKQTSLRFNDICGYIWLCGMIFLSGYILLQYFLLQRKLATAFPVESRYIRESNQISSPFVLGIFRPVIYLPPNLNDEERKFILAHEQSHVDGYDPLIKLLFLIALIVHWFNPFVWLAFFLFGRDIEMACDERVLKNFDANVRTDYSKTLLAFATRQSGLHISLAFGESNISIRIKHILNFKKPAFWIILTALILAVVVIFQCFSKPAAKEPDVLSETENETLPEDGDSLRQLFDYELLVKNRHRSTSDNNSNNELVSQLVMPEGIFLNNANFMKNTVSIHCNMSEDTFADLDHVRDILLERQNAVMLFSCIAELERVGFLYTPTNQDSGYYVSYNREAQALKYGALYTYSESPENLSGLMELCKTKWELEVWNITPTKEPLTMAELLKMFEAGTLSECNYADYKNRSFKEHYSDESGYTIFFSLNLDDIAYELQARYNNDSANGPFLDNVTLYKVKSMEFRTLYSSDSKNECTAGELEYFLSHTTSVHDWLSISLPEGYALDDYTQVGMTHNGGSFILPKIINPLIDNTQYMTKEWLYAGSVGNMSSDPFEFDENGAITGQSILLGSPHWSMMPVSTFAAKEFDAPCILYEMTCWLYSTTDLYELEQQGYSLEKTGVLMPDHTVVTLSEDDMKAEFWHFNFAKQGSEQGYYLSLSKREFTMEEAIEIAKTIRFNDGAF